MSTSPADGDTRAKASKQQESSLSDDDTGDPDVHSTSREDHVETSGEFRRDSNKEVPIEHDEDLRRHNNNGSVSHSRHNSENHKVRKALVASINHDIEVLEKQRLFEEGRLPFRANAKQHHQTKKMPLEQLSADSGDTDVALNLRGGTAQMVSWIDSEPKRKRLSEDELVIQVVGTNGYFEDSSRPALDDSSLSYAQSDLATADQGEAQAIHDTEESGIKHCNGINKRRIVTICVMVLLVAVTCAVVIVLVKPKSITQLPPATNPNDSDVAECDMQQLQHCGQEIMFSKKSLTGTIPSSIGLAQNVTHLDLSRNTLSGFLPSELGLLTALTYLSVEFNSLSGTLPTELGLLSSLAAVIRLDSNTLIGTIPTETGLLSNLTELRLFLNFLSGTIPTEIGLMSSLIDLQLESNALTGTIPTETGLLNNLNGLRLDTNSLTGTIPTEIGLMSSLIELGLISNTLKGTIPTEMGLLNSLNGLRLDTNALTGTIPTEIAFLSNLVELQLQFNSLTGTIPTEMESLRNLKHWGLDCQRAVDCVFQGCTETVGVEYSGCSTEQILTCPICY